MESAAAMFDLKDVIAGIVVAAGAIGTIVAKYKGLITFGKPRERRHCPDAVKKVCDSHVGIQLDVTRLNGEISDVKETQSKIYDRLETIDHKVDRLVGYTLGKNGVDMR